MTNDDIEWKIYYGDYSTYSNLDGPPETAPSRNVQCIVYRNEQTGRYILSHHDYYYWKPEHELWFGGDMLSLWDYLAQPGWKCVVMGRSVPNETFRDIHRKAVNDPDFPDKSAWEKDEKKPLE